MSNRFLLPAAFALLIFLSTEFSSAAIFQVTVTAPTGAGSLDAAVTAANGNGMGKDTIQFNIAGAGPHTINLNLTLQAINGDLLVDGTFQPGYNPLNPVPVIEIINSANTTFTVIGGSMEIRAVAFNSTNGHGLALNSGGCKIIGCYFGLGLDGITNKGNAFMGILVNSSNNIIGGNTLAERNIISGNNQQGIQINNANNNQIINNYIGVNAAGSAAVANQQNGLGLYTCTNTIVANNVISGNGQHGVIINLGSGHYIFGNHIGVNAAGTAGIGNLLNGLEIYGTNNCQIGGAYPDSTNIVSDNHIQGIHLSGDAGNRGTSNRIFGNIVGLLADGDSPAGNHDHGIGVEFNTGAQIGGNTAALGNIISSNGLINNSNGINIYSCLQTTVKNNIIGVSISTTNARGNGSHGVQIDTSPGTVIGGAHATEGNIISSNVNAGINF
ncbi:MAG TPA: hypothetical protein VHL77_08470, partial [Ferruginibacter sp.]|nr:hypothetical protein [Ferruginibacter sp.]